MGKKGAPKKMPWERGQAPKGFWDSDENVGDWVDWVEDRLGIREPEGWYQVSRSELDRLPGSGATQRYRSVRGLVRAFRPHVDWKDWLFPAVPAGFWQDPANHRPYLDWLGEQLGYEMFEDWYQIKAEDLKKNRGNSVLDYYSGSPSEVVMRNFPEYDWKEWLFSTTPFLFWEEHENVVRYLRWLGEELGYEEMEDWYQISTVVIQEYCGGWLLSLYGSLVTLLEDGLPEHEWLPWKLTAGPGFWDDAENCRRYLDWLAGELGVKVMEDWYRVTTYDFHENYGATFIQKYGSTLVVVRTFYPEYDWKEWLFARVAAGFWDVRENRLRYLDWLVERLGLESFLDLPSVPIQVFHDHHGAGLLRRFRNFAGVLRATYPDHEWHEWQFISVGPRFWSDPESCRRYLDWLAVQLDVTELDDWYRVNGYDFTTRHGSAFFQKYGPVAAIAKRFWPEHDWKEWLFERVPVGFWEDKSHRLRYLEWLAEQLGLADKHEWWTITTLQLLVNQGGGLLRRFETVDGILRATLPRSYVLKAEARARAADKARRLAALDKLRARRARVLERGEELWEVGLTPRSFWSDDENVRAYVDWLEEKLGIEDPEDWYRVRYNELAKMPGSGALGRYGSIRRLLRTFRPQVDWKEWLFPMVPVGYWLDLAHQKAYLDWLGEQLGYQTPEDWYEVTSDDFMSNSGTTLLHHYNGSLSAALKAVYPEHDWKEWLFQRIPWGFWHERKNRRRYLDWLAERFGLESRKELASLSREDFRRHKGQVLVQRFGTVKAILRSA